MAAKTIIFVQSTLRSVTPCLWAQKKLARFVASSDDNMGGTLMKRLANKRAFGSPCLIYDARADAANLMDDAGQIGFAPRLHIMRATCHLTRILQFA